MSKKPRLVWSSCFQIWQALPLSNWTVSLRDSKAALFCARLNFLNCRKDIA